MASCRTGRLPMRTDPLCAHYQFEDALFNLRCSHVGWAIFAYCFYYKMNHSHWTLQYKGPDNPYARIRHRRFPGGVMWFGWGNNGLNRDCNFLEWSCWAGYQGKEYTY